MVVLGGTGLSWLVSILLSWMGDVLAQYQLRVCEQIVLLFFLLLIFLPKLVEERKRFSQ